MVRLVAGTSWVMVVLALLLVTAVDRAGASRKPLDYVPAAELDAARRAGVEAAVADAIRDTLAARSRQHLFHSVRIGVCGNMAVVDLSAAFLPDGLGHLSAELEDQLHMISTTVLWTVESEFGLVLYGVLHTFDGKPLPYYYPDDYQPGDVDALACK